MNVYTLAALPVDSPVRKAVAAKRAAEAQKAAADKAKKQAETDARGAKQAKARLRYVNRVDPMLRIAKNALAEIAKLGPEARSGKLRGDELDQNVAGARIALGQLRTLLQGQAPTEAADLDEPHTALLAAVDTYDQAATTLLSATGASREKSLARFDTVAASARKSWNAALVIAYKGTGVKPPLVS